MSTILPDGTWLCCHNPLVVDDTPDDTNRCMTCGSVSKWGPSGHLVIVHEDFTPGWEARLALLGVRVP